MRSLPFNSSAHADTTRPSKIRMTCMILARSHDSKRRYALLRRYIVLLLTVLISFFSDSLAGRAYGKELRPSAERVILQERRLNVLQVRWSSCRPVRLVLSRVFLYRVSCYLVRLVLSCIAPFGLQRVCRPVRVPPTVSEARHNEPPTGSRGGFSSRNVRCRTHDCFSNAIKKMT